MIFFLVAAFSAWMFGNPGTSAVNPASSSLGTTVASAQAPQPVPAAPRQAPGPAAQIHTNLPADSVTVTHWYKQNVYDPSDNKIGEIMDMLVDRDGKVTALMSA